MRKIVINTVIIAICCMFVYLMLPVGISPKEIASSYNNLNSDIDYNLFSKRDFSTFTLGINSSEHQVSSGISLDLIEDFKKLINLPEEGEGGFWWYISDGKFTTYNEARGIGTGGVNNKDLRAIWESQLVSFNTNSWAWDSATNSKVTKSLTVRCNKKIAPLFEAALIEIYQSDEKPILESGGSYVWKGTPERISAHAMGLAIDFNVKQNPYYNGERVGDIDAYNAKGAVITKEMYDTIAVSDDYKRHVFYVGGAVTKILVEKYTFKWGATFAYKASQGGGDRMHFSFAGDGEWRDKAISYKENNNWADYYDGGILPAFK